MRVFRAFLALLCLVSIAHANELVNIEKAAFTPFSVNGAAPPPTNPTFVLPTSSTLKYINPAGNDACNGTSPSLGSSGNCAWLTPNHAMNCGEVIIAAAGTHNQAFNSWGTVSNCPSTSGGIDGTGGVNMAVLLCGGSDLGSGGCNINCSTAACSAGLLGSGGRNAASAGMNVNKNFWAVEGWTINGNSSHRGFQVDACLTISTIIHHVAFINDIVANSGVGFTPNDCGYGSAPTNTNGGDYFAVVGDIAQNSAQDTICVGAVDVAGPAQLDAGAGTHVYFYSSFSYANTNVTCRSISDTSGFFFDTWDAHNVGYQGVIANNIGYGTDRYCVDVFYQNVFPNTPTIKIYHNTCYHDLNFTGGDFLDGEINTSSTSPFLLPFPTTIQNNIAYQTLATSSGGGAIAAMVAINTTTFTSGGTGNENVLKANNSSCTSTNCNSTFDNQYGGSAGGLGIQFYIAPAFTNTTDLLANQQGVPNCTGFDNVTGCMGWNANTATLTAPSVISDLVPTAGSAVGKGYVLPSTACATNADYPTWLKGVVYLVWNGSTLTENSDLVSKPCGL